MLAHRTSVQERLQQYWVMAFGLAALVLVANFWIARNGAAANPYAVLLLIPVAAAMMILPFKLGWSITVLTVIAQLGQLYIHSPNQHAMDMNHHYQAMVYGQVFAMLLLALTLHVLRRTIVNQERAIKRLHERQVRDEQLVAIGTAAAQFSHEIATPIQSIQLLLDEVATDPAAVTEIQQQTQRIHELLLAWREVAEAVREGRQTRLSIVELEQQLQDSMMLVRPDVDFVWQRGVVQQEQIIADHTLVPALLSLLHNAADSCQGNPVIVRSEIFRNNWQLSMINDADAPSIPAEQLGQSIQKSARGFGIGAMLSFVSIERFSGQVHWHHRAGQTHTQVTLPLAQS
ncbi:HAMP domain-containing histidine kinase [Pseudidiomarina taiwanensis]|uniref:Histidine kinase domain-containing protein n=1 Tax=Pseudidiomarina taiwanensis TaxID=337250 RepID=A0A432ZEI8_9GAMM|nr:HAMP domain-containing histidine kinase [Pseudidiomarina taiwanensis]RUO76368.1 hypothetical protein CWI83_08370 [Pseudidiomarina taiwanensis]